jgi:hypothetical protein
MLAKWVRSMLRLYKFGGRIWGGSFRLSEKKADPV